MLEPLMPFFVIFWGLFISSIYQFSVLYGEIYKLWSQEIVYDNNSIITNKTFELIKEGSETKKCKAKLTKKEKELFSKIDYLANETSSLAKSLRVYVIILCLISVVFSLISKLSLNEIEDQGISFERAGEVTNLLSGVTFTIFIFILIIVIIILLKYSAKIDIIHPEKTARFDEMLFDIWYKHKCFEYRNCCFKNELQPKILYKLLAHKYKINEKTFDGKKIELSDDLIQNLKRSHLLSKDK